MKIRIQGYDLMVKICRWGDVFFHAWRFFRKFFIDFNSQKWSSLPVNGQPVGWLFKFGDRSGSGSLCPGWFFPPTEKHCAALHNYPRKRPSSFLFRARTLLAAWRRENDDRTLELNELILVVPLALTYLKASFDCIDPEYFASTLANQE